MDIPSGWAAFGGAVIGGLVSLAGIYINYIVIKRDRELGLRKEEFFKLQEKIEVILSGLSFYWQTVRTIQSGIESGNHFEKDFKEEGINKRLNDNYGNAHDFIFIYFEALYKDLGDLRKIYVEIVDLYFYKILGAPRDGLNIKYTKEDAIIIAEKINIFIPKYDELVKNIREELNKKRNDVF